MPRPLLSTVAVIALAGSLGACASSRIEDGGGRGRVGPQAALVEPVVPVPSGAVTSSPLAPPPGVAAAPEGAPPPAVGDVAAVAPGASVIAEPVTPPPPPPPVVTTGRSAVVGSWNARDATGGTCKVSLSSAPALDLYKATASGCPNKELAKVSAWDYRDGEVYLYQPGGTVAARLRQGSGSLDGALSKSGAALALAR